MTTIEDQLRERLARATTDVWGAPDLGASLSAGRRRRVARGAGLGVAGTGAAATVAAVSLVGLGAAHRPPDATPADRLPWTRVDDVLVTVVADHVASPGQLTRVYPSDWTRTTPLPAAEVDRATEWLARYRVNADETLSVVMSQRPTDAKPGPVPCPRTRGIGVVSPSDIEPGGSVEVDPGAGGVAPSCVTRAVAGGTLVVTRDGDSETAALYRTADDTLVIVTSKVSAGAGHAVTPAELEAVATDARLSFPHAVDPPAWPNSNGPGWPSGT